MIKSPSNKTLERIFQKLETDLPRLSPKQRKKLIGSVRPHLNFIKGDWYLPDGKTSLRSLHVFRGAGKLTERRKRFIRAYRTAEEALIQAAREAKLAAKAGEPAAKIVAPELAKKIVASAKSRTSQEPLPLDHMALDFDNAVLTKRDWSKPTDFSAFNKPKNYANAVEEQKREVAKLNAELGRIRGHANSGASIIDGSYEGGFYGTGLTEDMKSLFWIIVYIAACVSTASYINFKMNQGTNAPESKDNQSKPALTVKQSKE